MATISALCEALKGMRLIDLSQLLEEHMPRFPTHSQFYHNLWSSYQFGDRSLSYQLLMNEHSGTHVDAPAHFMSEAHPDAHVTIDRVPLGQLIGRGVRLDCRGFREGQNVPADFITEWERGHAPITAGDIVLFNFGWDKRWAIRPHDVSYTADWPGVSLEAAAYLLGKQIAAVGVDTLSPDSQDSLRTGPVHPLLLERRVLIVENLCRLDELPDTFVFAALPLKIRRGSGSPVRAIALC